MSDRLEQFINDNREGFDIYEPEPLLWEKVSLKKKESRFAVLFRSNMVRIAAILLLALGVWSVYRIYDTPSGEIAQTETVPQHIDIPELAEAANFYQAKLNERMSEINPLLTSHPTLKHSLHSDMAQLDSIYRELQIDLGDGMANEAIVDAMIQNYRMKLKILENVLFYIKKSKGTNNNSDATENKEYEI